MRDVLVYTTINESNLDLETLNSFNSYSKYFSEKLKKVLSENEISSSILSSKCGEIVDTDLKCFLNIEFNIALDKEIVDIFSPKAVNKSHDFASKLNMSLGELSRLKYDNIDFKGNDLSYQTSKVHLKIYLYKNLVSDEGFLDNVAILISKGIGKYLGISMSLQEKNRSLRIINNRGVNKNKAKQFSKNMGINENIIRLIDYYWKFYKEHGNVDPLIAYAQAIVNVEDNKLDYKYFNPGGIKDIKINSDGNYTYKKFNSIKEGVQAQLDHLALFAGAEGYPKTNSLDPRHFKYLFGSCKTVENLSGKWDSDKFYGNKILQIYNEIDEINDFSEYSEEELFTLSLESKIDKFGEKIIVMGNLLESVFKEYGSLYKELDELRNEVVSINDDKKSLELQKEDLEKKVIKQKSVIKDILNVIGGSIEKK